MRGQLLEQMAGSHHGQEEQEEVEALRAMQRENAEWKEVLEQIYAEFQVPKETFEYCYLYVITGYSASTTSSASGGRCWG